MRLPSFYDDAPGLTIYDPLSALLGAAEDGILRYGYADAVRLAGHSCPTVAGAYLMTVRSLGHLYGDALPVRGEIEVYLHDEAETGVAGVMANVATLLTGAAGGTGFKGLGGRFDRRRLLIFGADIEGQIAFRRRDNGIGVQAFFDLAVVPADPETADLLRRCLTDQAGGDEAARFRELWKGRVRQLLVDHVDNPLLIRLEDWPD